MRSWSVGVYAAAETCKTVSFYISPFKKSIKKNQPSFRGRRKDIGIRWHFLVTHWQSAFSTKGLKLNNECDSVSLNADMSTQIRGLPAAAGSRWAVQVGSSSLWCPGPPREAPPPQSHPAARLGWWSAALAHGSPGRGAVWLRIASTNIAQVLTQSFNLLWFWNVEHLLWHHKQETHSFLKYKV